MCTETWFKTNIGVMRPYLKMRHTLSVHDSSTVEVKSLKKDRKRRMKNITITIMRISKGRDEEGRCQRIKQENLRVIYVVSIHVIFRELPDKN
jgi:hypothetical protein